MQDWLDISVAGDVWEVEITAEGRKFRHRPISRSGMGQAWIEGQPPSGPHAVHSFGRSPYLAPASDPA